MILGRKPNVQNAMKDSRLWMTQTTMGHELQALNAMNSRGLWML